MVEVNLDRLRLTIPPAAMVQIGTPITATVRSPHIRDTRPGAKTIFLPIFFPRNLLACLLACLQAENLPAVFLYRQPCLPNHLRDVFMMYIVFGYRIITSKLTTVAFNTFPFQVGLADDMLREIVPTAPLFLAVTVRTAGGDSSTTAAAIEPTPLATPIGKEGALEDAFDALASGLSLPNVR